MYSIDSIEEGILPIELVLLYSAPGANSKSTICVLRNKSLVFYQTGGRGVKLFFLKQHSFQLQFRTSLGPPKHILHLVWSSFVVSTANRTALKAATGAQILKKEGQY